MRIATVRLTKLEVLVRSPLHEPGFRLSFQRAFRCTSINTELFLLEGFLRTKTIEMVGGGDVDALGLGIELFR